MTERIYLSKADVTPLEEEYVLRALRSGWIAPLGPDVDAFEAEMESRTGVTHALAVSSGTAALHLALLHLGARPGTTVVVPSLTFAATANAVVYTGASIAFVDCDPDDGNVDPDTMLAVVDRLQSQGHEVVAAISVDLFGRACNYREIATGLRARNVPLLEDAAEALGASQDGQPAGSFGTAAALSFNGNKIMTTSGGGMLLSNDADLIGHARKLSTQAREPVPWYEHVEVGYNYRMSNILAALGRAQLARLDSMVERRRLHRDRYKMKLSALPVRFLGSGPDSMGRKDNAWLTALELLGRDASPVIADLNNKGIEARHLWKPLHLQPAYSRYTMANNGVAERLFYSGICLPSGSGLKTADIDRVSAELHKSLSK